MLFSYRSPTSFIEEALRWFSILRSIKLVIITHLVCLTELKTHVDILYEQFYSEQVAIIQGTFFGGGSGKYRNYYF